MSQIRCGGTLSSASSGLGALGEVGTRDPQLRRLSFVNCQIELLDIYRERVGRTSRPVSRVLSLDRLAALAQGTTIHLGLLSPTTSCGLPADSGEQPSNVCAAPAGADTF